MRGRNPDDWKKLVIRDKEFFSEIIEPVGLLYGGRSIVKLNNEAVALMTRLINEKIERETQEAREAQQPQQEEEPVAQEQREDRPRSQLDVLRGYDARMAEENKKEFGRSLIVYPEEQQGVAGRAIIERFFGHQIAASLTGPDGEKIIDNLIACLKK
jgi:hypothetical protein